VGRCSVAVVAVNAGQAEDWNGVGGREFVEQRERHERMLGRLWARLLAAAAIQDGEYVLDVGCGCGETTTLAARAGRWRTGNAVQDYDLAEFRLQAGVQEG
jgi:2-polyprenyl-3-methyl-5-hydroxy-6-metoxy-1,4-benzoquinol methylase